MGSRSVSCRRRSLSARRSVRFLLTRFPLGLQCQDNRGSLLQQCVQNWGAMGTEPAQPLPRCLNPVDAPGPPGGDLNIHGRFL